MKKLVLILVISSFVAFGTLGVQNVNASSARVEIVKFDKDPKKAGEKKVAESKNTKTTETKTATTDTKVSTSGTDKKATSTGCNDHDKGGCCSSSPDKK